MCRATVLCSALLHSSLVQAANSILKIMPWTKLFASWLSFSMYNYWITLINWTRGQLVIFQSTNIFRASTERHVKSFSSTFKSRLANHTREQEQPHKQPDTAQEKKKKSIWLKKYEGHLQQYHIGKSVCSSQQNHSFRAAQTWGSLGTKVSDRITQSHRSEGTLKMT